MLGHLWAVLVLALELCALARASFGWEMPGKPRSGAICGNQLLDSFQWFEEKLQEVECEDQRLRKLHAVVETLVNHRKGDELGAA